MTRHKERENTGRILLTPTQCQIHLCHTPIIAAKVEIELAFQCWYRLCLQSSNGSGPQHTSKSRCLVGPKDDPFCLAGLPDRIHRGDSADEVQYCPSNRYVAVRMDGDGTTNTAVRDSRRSGCSGLRLLERRPRRNAYISAVAAELQETVR